MKMAMKMPINKPWLMRLSSLIHWVDLFAQRALTSRLESSLTIVCNSIHAHHFDQHLGFMSRNAQ